MSLERWLAFVATLAVVSVSPGTGALAVMGTALRSGARQAIPVVLGLQGPLLLYSLLVSFGLAAIVGHGAVFEAIRWTGVAYLLYLGLRSLWAPSGSLALGNATAPARGWTGLAEGFLVNATNPKTVVFMAALFPQFVRPEAPLGPQLVVLCATLLAIDITVMMGYAHLAATLARWLRHPRHLAWLNRIVGGWFLVLAALLASGP